MLNFADAWKSFGKNAFTFDGRSSRAAFWWVILGLLIFGSITFFLVDSLLTGNGIYGENVYEIKSYSFTVAFAIASLLPLLSLTVRRFHDAGVSPIFFSIIVLLPVATYVALEMLSSGDIEGYRALEHSSFIISILYAIQDYALFGVVISLIVICCIPSRFSRYLKYPMDDY